MKVGGGEWRWVNELVLPLKSYQFLQALIAEFLITQLNFIIKKNSSQKYHAKPVGFLSS